VPEIQSVADPFPLQQDIFFHFILLKKVFLIAALGKDHFSKRMINLGQTQSEKENFILDSSRSSTSRNVTLMKMKILT
jgi:hypothetical protein